MTRDLDATDGVAAEPAGRRRLGKRAKLGIVLVVLSFLIFFALPAITFLPFSTGTKWYLSGGMVIFCYGMQYAGIFLAGPEVAGPVIAWFRNWLPWKKAAGKDVQVDDEILPPAGAPDQQAEESADETANHDN